MELAPRLYTLGRHGLDYAKLYHDFEGGYDMEQLKTILQRVKQDKEDGFHPFVDKALDRELEAKLQQTLKVYKENKAKAKEGDGEAESEEPEEEAP